MDVHIRISGGNEVVEFPLLLDWLAAERALAGAVRPIRNPPVDGQLGGGLDTLAVALTSSTVGAALARSLTIWLQNRRSDVKLTITSKDRTVELDAHRITDVPNLLREVLPPSDEP